MVSNTYRGRWMGLQVVIALPEHINVSNASQIREELLWVINRGAVTVIADMTATRLCDHSGADAVMRAYRRALASGTQLRLVVSAPVVRRVLGINGLDRLIPVYSSLEAATVAETPTIPRSSKPGGLRAPQILGTVTSTLKGQPDAGLPGEGSRPA